MKCKKQRDDMKYAIFLMSLSIFSGNFYAADGETRPPMYLAQPLPSAPYKANDLELQSTGLKGGSSSDSSVMIKDVDVDGSVSYTNSGSCHCCVLNFIYGGEKPKDQ